jgi:hypothetical protein
MSLCAQQGIAGDERSSAKGGRQRDLHGQGQPRVGRACCAARQRASAAVARAAASPAATSASDARASAAASASAAAAAAPAAATDAASAPMAACGPRTTVSSHCITRRWDGAPGAQQIRGRPYVTPHAVRFCYNYVTRTHRDIFQAVPLAQPLSSTCPWWTERATPLWWPTLGQDLKRHMVQP